MTTEKPFWKSDNSTIEPYLFGIIYRNDKAHKTFYLDILIWLIQQMFSKEEWNSSLSSINVSIKNLKPQFNHITEY